MRGLAGAEDKADRIHALKGGDLGQSQHPGNITSCQVGFFTGIEAIWRCCQVWPLGLYCLHRQAGPTTAVLAGRTLEPD